MKIIYVLLFIVTVSISTLFFLNITNDWIIEYDNKEIKQISEKEDLHISDKEKVDNQKNEQLLLTSGLKTDTSKRSIKISEILDGGPGKDWIPSINSPKFLSIENAKKQMDYLNNKSNGISVEIDWEARFYPYNILVWHEITNDSIWDKKISVTFCPLCWSAIVYDRDINWEEVLFWVSWKLYESNLLMYDNKTESLWSQSLWKSVVWEYLWTDLKIINSNLMTFEEFTKKYKNWKVLSDDTWFNRSYWYVPYWDYDESDTLYFPVWNEDLRYNKKEIFYIINDQKESVAFLFKDLREKWFWEITIWNIKYKATFKEWILEVRKWNKIINWYYEMWFSWINHNVGNKNVWSIK